MASGDVRVVVLYEDVAHRQFVQRLAIKLGLKPLRLERCGGCTEVLDRFIVELKEMRPRMKYQRNLGLLVVVDADAATTAARRKDLERRLADSNTGGARAPDERIAYLVPALEIENWYVHLCVPAARPVDEARDYKPEAVWKELARDLPKAAREAVDAWPKQEGRMDPSSLSEARQELARL